MITDVPADVLDERRDGARRLNSRCARAPTSSSAWRSTATRRVVVGIDESRDRAVAYRQDDCSLVARASLS